MVIKSLVYNYVRNFITFDNWIFLTSPQKVNYLNLIAISYQVQLMRKIWRLSLCNNEVMGVIR